MHNTYTKKVYRPGKIHSKNHKHYRECFLLHCYRILEAAEGLKPCKDFFWSNVFSNLFHTTYRNRKRVFINGCPWLLDICCKPLLSSQFLCRKFQAYFSQTLLPSSLERRNSMTLYLKLKFKFTNLKHSLHQESFLLNYKNWWFTYFLHVLPLQCANSELSWKSCVDSSWDIFPLFTTSTVP